MTFRYLLCLIFATALLTIGFALTVESLYTEEALSAHGALILASFCFYGSLAMGAFAYQLRPLSWFEGR
jgi:hypothetical protein